MNPFVGALGNQEPVILGQSQIKLAKEWMEGQEVDGKCQAIKLISTEGRISPGNMLHPFPSQGLLQIWK
jgi:hypothetical protein